ncbi:MULTISPECIES: dihydrolipoyl dehydrogenase [unclassified Shinella]|uniref:dihydrolipoyl dehydrogenase n=1 Tax=unclassified Shinella TaxID=2643062 RepID=UPI00225C4A68|nr:MULTISPECIES: dihydrolipoyl dehydrogenase [unclassified Shinella]MCO5138203.1 dihydrolipoyl dehydrogenase [Shinella sp.]MDC7258320.1 dihydrolipoyl dehydrogenase [Shinella sp. YE25]CAI0335666.1 Dihydrolipoyl dehydrogenase 3 [Rhizobiaceae bacterium]CAK7259969.1 Dihydrolipoyl dehydrogenase 3 [Shinella sp. WSC3-e]
MNVSGDYDVLVIGGGPGGYACAIRAAQLGLKAACVEARPTLGGTCLNVGCIPSKTLLHATHLLELARDGHMAGFGIDTGPVSIDLARLMARKEATVASLAGGIDFLFRKNGVARLPGRARLAGPGRVDIDGRMFAASAIVIATGSLPAALAGVPADNEAGVVVDSSGALSLPRIPERLAVIGGGVIGLELGSVWRRLGAQVTIVEVADGILPGMDADIRATMTQLLARQGMTILASTAVASADIREDGATLQLKGADGKASALAADVVLVATGRRPNTGDLGLETVGITPDAGGFIPVDACGRTGADGIHAIGDVTRGPMLAHRAEDEGIAVAERLAGRPGMVNPAIVPVVVYTDPEVASVGRTEQMLTAEGIAYHASTFPMSANSRAKASGGTEGFVKLLAEEASGVVLGAHMVGTMAGTMIAEVAQAMEFGATAEDIAYTCHAHPTHSEAVKEAALGFFGAAIHR